MHPRTHTRLLAIVTLLAASFVGCGGDAPLLEDGGLRDVGTSGCSVNNGGCSTTPMVVCSLRRSVLWGRPATSPRGVWRGASVALTRTA